jgi:hypothetical protein
MYVYVASFLQAPPQQLPCLQSSAMQRDSAHCIAVGQVCPSFKSSLSGFR